MAQTTLKYRQISGGLDGWIPAEETWTYASASTFTVSADVTTKYQINDKLKLTQTTVKHFRITAVSTYSGGNTTITVDGFGISTLANAAISANYYSKMDNPQGFPQKEVLLFSGTPAASITLSETSANFDRLYVVYTQDSRTFSMMAEVGYSNSNTVVIQGLIDGAYRIRLGSTALTISGTGVAFGTSGSNYSTDTTSASAVAFSDVKIAPLINKVIGYRW